MKLPGKQLEEILARRAELIAEAEEQRNALAHYSQTLQTPVRSIVWSYHLFSFVKKNPLIVTLASALLSRYIFSRLWSLCFTSPPLQKRNGWKKIGVWVGRATTALNLARQIGSLFMSQRRFRQEIIPAEPKQPDPRP